MLILGSRSKLFGQDNKSKLPPVPPIESVPGVVEEENEEDENSNPAPDEGVRGSSTEPSGDPVADAAAAARMEVKQDFGVATNNIRYFSNTTFEQKYDTEQNGPASKAKVELYYTKDGETWNLAAADQDNRGTLLFEMPGDGRFGVKLVTTDAAGNVDDTWKTLERRYLFVIDRVGPQAALSSQPEEGIDLAPESHILLQWNASDENPAPKPVIIEYSVDNGNQWDELQQDLPAQGSVNYWVPKRPGYDKEYRLLFRALATDIAGNRTTTPLLYGFKIVPDNIGMPPDDHQMVAQAADGFPEKPAGPLDPMKMETIVNRVNQSNFNIEYQVKNVGESGIKYVELWHTNDDGRTWKYYGRDEDKRSPFPFTAPQDGVYGFYLIVENNAGQRLGKRPGSGMLPPKESLTLVDTVAPFVQLLSPRGGDFWKGYDRNHIDFKVFDFNLKQIDLYLSQDSGKSWTLHTANIANQGNFDLPTSAFNCKTMRVKIVALDYAGNWTSEESEKDFAIDNRVPEVALTDVSTRVTTAAANAGAQPAATPHTDEPGNTTGQATVQSGNAAQPDFMLEADKAYQRGIYHRARKEYPEAQRMFERALEIDDRYDPAYYEIGYLYLKQGRLDLAKDYMQRALLLRDSAIYHAGLAKASMAEGDTANALIQLNRVAEMEPRAAGSLAVDALWCMADLYASQRDFISATKVLTEISSLDNPPSQYRREALDRIAAYREALQQQLRQQEAEKKQ